MKSFKGFKIRQYQLPVCSNKKDKHRSLKSKIVNDLFVGKITYNPMLFRNTCRYPITNRQYVRRQIKLLRELREQYYV